MAGNPIHIPAVFAEGGNKNPIQKTLQVGQDPQSMTWTSGTPLITMTPIADGGKAPQGQDFNGVLNAVCAHTVFGQNGGRYKWSADVISNYGGYSKDFIIQSDNGVTEFISLVDNNTVNPNTTLGTSWAVYAGQGSVPNASSTTAGILRVLNVLTSTDINAALSANMGKQIQDILNKFEMSLTANGYIKIPVGNRTFILQWFSGVSTTIGDADFTVNYPIPFPTACLGIQVTTRGGAASQTDGMFQERSFSRTSCVVNSQVFGVGSIAAGITPKIWALGY